MEISKPGSSSFWSSITLIGPLFVAMGCSLLSQKSQAPGAQSGEKFGGAAVWSENIMPVPAEVAADIAQLRSGRSITLPPSNMTGNSGWQQFNNPNRNLASETPEQEQLASYTNEDEIANKNPAEEPPAEAESNASSEKKKVRKLSSDRPIVLDKSGRNESYKVKAGDTLMKIAFAKYGNVYRWREILAANEDLIRDFNRLTPGTELMIYGVQYVAIEQDGEIYLIRKNDTLVKISRKLYGSTAYWVNLWKKNQLLIRNPDKIYAGFTMYYDPLEKIKRER